ncbi:MAG: hypothetical protein LBJ81_01035 [Puniceicoccales bacterium]|jgi:hypothetical protein|nr:hypothetical protein [Puniceicoccales bacterium]
MTAKNKIRLVVAASYGSALFYNSAFAAWTRPPSHSSSSSSDSSSSSGYSSSSSSSSEEVKRRHGKGPQRFRFVQRSSPVSESEGGEELSDCSPEEGLSEEFEAQRPYEVVLSGTGIPTFKRPQKSAPPELALQGEEKHHRRHHIRRQDLAPSELDLTRKATVTGFFDKTAGHEMSSGDKTRNLSRRINGCIMTYMQEATPAFVKFVVETFAKAHCKKNEDKKSKVVLKMLRLRIADPDMYAIITRSGQFSPEVLLKLEQAKKCVYGERGVIKQIKDRVMDETLGIIRDFICPDISEEAIEQLEAYVDAQLISLSRALVDVVFELLRSDTFVPTGCCGWCRGLSSKEKRSLTGAVVQIVGGVLGTIFPGVEQGANTIARVICGGISGARSDGD